MGSLPPINSMSNSVLNFFRGEQTNYLIFINPQGKGKLFKAGECYNI